ncbi:hypothetical protein ACFFSW_17150 [Saccharothrix longispora]|uniref:Lipoprotein n=1 Tax=Saccharothrix longispora TaxID=33920 RepID=A0ABU1PSK0_9PSEU|nr:hypothetical protein [Saccharothrix longispora]MDR6593628.1 hypothetical protein [Saccharothrix longispora]
MSSGLLTMVACTTPQAEDVSAPESTRAEHPDPRVATSVVVPSPQARGSVVIVAGRVDWTAHRPGCVVLELPSGQRFQLTGTTADDGERQGRAGARPTRQDVRATGHIPPVGATSCGPIRAFWAHSLTANGN